MNLVLALYCKLISILFIGDYEPTEKDGEITNKISWIHFDIDDCRSVRDTQYYSASNVAR